MLKVVTDSTSYIPPPLLKQYDITVVPLKVHFGPETYDEVTGINNFQFFERLRATAAFPTTSQPAIGQFRQAYQDILRQHPTAQILTLPISRKLSGTYNSALAAAEQLPQANITVFDTGSAALGIGLMAFAAVEMAQAGQPLAHILARLEWMRSQISIVLMVDNLEYLRRGGRIGAAAAFLGTLLNTKPILAVIDGLIQPLDRVRTKKKAVERLLTELESRLADPAQPIQAGVMHIGAEAEMNDLVALMRERFNLTRLFTSEIGPVIGAHLGPGALGAGFCPEPAESAAITSTG
jgi:DegV family protein with EDD domain